jgi:ferrous iron transport protein A
MRIIRIVVCDCGGSGGDRGSESSTRLRIRLICNTIAIPFEESAKFWWLLAATAADKTAPSPPPRELTGLPLPELPRCTDLMTVLTLERAPLGTRHVVAAVCAPANTPEWTRWLEEIGFIPGEKVMLMAKGAFGADPLVVRVGQSTFALRRAEAACVHVRVEAEHRTHALG